MMVALFSEDEIEFCKEKDHRRHLHRHIRSRIRRLRWIVSIVFPVWLALGR